MTQRLQNAPQQADPRSTAHIVHALMHFLRVARYRKSVIIVSAVVVGLLGAFYYATATRIYQSEAQLLVLQAGPDVLNTSMSSDGYKQNLMPTYERLFTSAVVLEGAVRELAEKDPEFRVDFASHPPEKWVGILRNKLHAKSLRRTNIIEVSYQSKSRAASAAVVNAAVNSYLRFVEENHKNVAAEIVALLKKERGEVEQRLMAKEQRLIDAKRDLSDFGLDEGSKVLHPVVNTAVQLNEALIEIRQRRLELDSLLATVHASIAKGGNLRQHLLTIEPAIGRELILDSLGLSRQDVETVARLQEALIEQRAKLYSLQEHYGPVHPEVVETAEKVRNTEQYLVDRHNRINRTVADREDDQLAPMLLAMVQEELDKAWRHERNLLQQYREAEADAVRLNGRMAEAAIIEHDIQLLRNLHDVLVQRISNIDINQNRADVRVAVVSEPKVPDHPVSPSLSIVAFICLLAGIGGGGVIVYVLDVLDDRFRSPDEMSEQLGSPLLAMVRQLETREGIGGEVLQVHMAPDAVESEAFRTLRTALAFSGDEVGRLVVSSAEPGDGKTTVLANLAVSCAQAGRKTLIIDADLRRPGLTKLFELRTEGGLSELLRSEENGPDVFAQRIRPSGINDLDIMPCGPRPSDPSELLSGPGLADLIAWAETVYDQILIDSPPILAASDSAIVGRLVDGLVLVVQPEKNHRRIVLRAVEGVRALGVTLIGVVVNRLGGDQNRGYYGYGGGYGYGYGYGYGEGYGNEDDEDEYDRQAVGDDSEVADEDSQPAVIPMGQHDPPVGDQCPKNVPRRAA